MCSLLCVLVVFLVLLWVVAAQVLSDWRSYFSSVSIRWQLSYIQQESPKNGPADDVTRSVWVWKCTWHLCGVESQQHGPVKKKKNHCFTSFKKKKKKGEYGIVQLGTKPKAGQLKHCWGRVGRSVNTGSLIAFTAHSSRLHVRRRMSQTADLKYPSYMRLCGELYRKYVLIFTNVAFSLMLALLENSFQGEGNQVFGGSSLLFDIIFCVRHAFMRLYLLKPTPDKWQAKPK